MLSLSPVRLATSRAAPLHVATRKSPVAAAGFVWTNNKMGSFRKSNVPGLRPCTRSEQVGHAGERHGLSNSNWARNYETNNCSAETLVLSDGPLVIRSL
jgi:hypothetical protein